MKQLLLCFLLLLLPNLASAATSIGIGSTTVTGGTNGYILYNNAGILGNLNPSSLANNCISITSPPYNAVGDWNGTSGTDNTTAIQNAMTALAGKCVLIPAGVYLITSQINVPDGTTVIGSGTEGDTATWPTIYGTVIVSNQSTFNFLNLGNYVTLKDLTFDRSANSITATSGTVIYSNNKTSLRLINIFIHYAYDGITFTGTSPASTGGSRLRGISIKNYTHTGMTFQNTVSDDISEFFCVALPGSTSTGIKLMDSANTIRFSNGDIIFGKNGIITSSSATFGSGSITAFPYDDHFTNVGIDSQSDWGIIIDRTGSFTFEGGWVGSNTFGGIHILQTEDVQFKGVTITNNGGAGVWLDISNGASKGVVFTDNSIHNNNTSNNGGSGIYISAAESDFIITNNRFSNLTAFTNFAGQQVWGVFIESGVSNNYIITNNLVHGNATGGISDGGTGTNKNVSNNF